MKAIETQFDGFRFRSRTEARWSVFFKVAGIKFDYELEGFELPNGDRYLPDFWLSDAKMWFEVKGEQPSESERVKCKMLAEGTGCDVMLAVGPPDSRRENIHLFQKQVDPPFDEAPLRIMADRRNAGEFWLGNFSAYGCCTRIIHVPGSPEHDRYPIISPIQGAYDAAKGARFEFGEAGA